MTLSYSSRCALVVETAKRLRVRGSWCGETHLQKTIYLLQDISKSSFGYKFIIYKHGPYSFDLNSDLAAMRSTNILEFKFLKDGYGPSIVPTEFGERVLRTNAENILELEPLVEFLSEWFAGSDVRTLEKLATAYFVTQKNPRDPAISRAKKLHALKPHIDIQAAEEAMRVVDEKRALAKEKFGEMAA